MSAGNDGRYRMHCEAVAAAVAVRSVMERVMCKVSCTCVQPSVPRRASTAAGAFVRTGAHAATDSADRDARQVCASYSCC